MSKANIPGPFQVRPMAMAGYRLIQWQQNGQLRSLQTTTDVAHLWATSDALYGALLEVIQDWQERGTVEADTIAHAQAAMGLALPPEGIP